MGSFNKKEYEKKYRKETHCVKIVIDTTYEKREEIKALLKKHNLTYVDVFMNAIKELQKKDEKK